MKNLTTASEKIAQRTAKLKRERAKLRVALSDLLSVVRDYKRHGDDYLWELNDSIELAEKTLKQIK